MTYSCPDMCDDVVTALQIAKAFDAEAYARLDDDDVAGVSTIACDGIARLARERAQLLTALRKIASEAPEEEPGDEEWNDMEHAWNCGHTQAQFEAAFTAREAIRKVQP